MVSDDLHGSLVAVSTRIMGDQFRIAASIGATTLSLNDVSDFDEAGGTVAIGSALYGYDSANMDLDTIHLTSALTAAASVDDAVLVWDPAEGAVVSERSALVAVEDQDGDPISAILEHSLSTLLPDTTLASGQSISMTPDGAAYRVAQVHGKTNQAFQRSNATGLQYGLDQNDGTITGLTVTAAGTVFLTTLLSAKVTAPDGVTFKPILASAFTVSSDAALKTHPTAGPDALSIIAAAPAKHWRYKSDPKDVKRVGPMADDLPEWLQQVDEETGALGVDLARQSGLHHRAIEQLLARIEALETELDTLKGKP